MATINQLVKNPKIRPKRRSPSPALKKNPQKRGICLKVFIRTPRKPNSAKRKVARIRIPSLKNKKITISIPGLKKNHNLQAHSKLLIRGGNVRDIPGVRYRAIMGKFDLKP